MAVSGVSATTHSAIRAEALAILIVAAAIILGYRQADNWRELLAFVLSAGFGGLVGGTEIVSRYKDKPVAALTSIPSMVYCAVNAAASLAAFWLLHRERIKLPVDMFNGHTTLGCLFVGGFGAMALFRASFFNVRMNDATVGVGPAAVLQVILRVADRETDRLRAERRAKRVPEIMRNVVYDRARVPLPLYCFALMQNVQADEQGNVENALAILERRADMGDGAKAYSLGLILINVVGEDVLWRAVAGLGERIKGPRPDIPPVLGRAKTLKLEDMPAILAGCEELTGKQQEPSQRVAILAAPSFGTSVESDKVLLILMRLRAEFGPEVVSVVIDSLLTARNKDGRTGGAGASDTAGVTQSVTPDDLKRAPGAP